MAEHLVCRWKVLKFAPEPFTHGAQRCGSSAGEQEPFRVCTNSAAGGSAREGNITSGKDHFGKCLCERVSAALLVSAELLQRHAADLLEDSLPRDHVGILRRGGFGWHGGNY